MKTETAILLLTYKGTEIKYNGKPLLAECLDNLIKTNGDYKIVCMANGDVDGKEGRYVTEHYKDVDVMSQKENDHMTKIYNKAVLYAIEKYDPKYLVIFSNDVFVTEPSWLESLIKTLDEHKSAGIAGCKLLYPDGKIQFGGIKKGGWMHNKGKGNEDKGEYDYVDNVEAIHMACMVVRAEMFDKVGLFDEKLRYGFDDTDFCMRAQEKGYDVIYNGKVSLIHLDGITLNKDATDQYDRSKDIDKFEGDQETFIYFTKKHYKGVKRFAGLAWVVFGRSMFTTSRRGVIGLGNFKLNDKIGKRISISLNAMRKNSS